MEAKIVLDISSIVWDENHFNSNKNNYYALKNEVALFINAFDNCNNLKLVARQELLNEVRILFPYNICKDHSMFDFQRLVLQFLATKRNVSYQAINSTTSIIPNICYSYFSSDLQTEISYLITEIHNNYEKHIFCTFGTRWQNNKNLKTINGGEKEHCTVIHKDSNYTIKDYYLENIRNIFEHNPKHDSQKGIHYDEKGNKINPLSCYDERKKDTSIPQKYLEEAEKYNNEYYYYDGKIFICFKNTRNNVYHGYDIYDEDITDKNLKDFLEEIKEQYHK